MKRAYYQNDISSFLKDDPGKILKELQKNACRKQIINLQEQLSGLQPGQIFFEFPIPRMGKRADVLLLIRNVVFVIEYKTGAKTYERGQIDQTLDYALDLKNFHDGSHNRYIVPILVCTQAAVHDNTVVWYADGIAMPLLSNGKNLCTMIKKIVAAAGGANDTPKETQNVSEWAESACNPIPTIIEAAQALYQGHAVAEISRSDASAKNLTLTAKCINSIIENSRKNGKKSICFVTGAPGAGKTLTGLNISTQKLAKTTEEHAAFLSGNGPLVAILREALIRDEIEHAKAQGKKISKETVKRKVSAFIQDVRHFRDKGLKSDAPPVEHVVVFDDAQRVWNRIQAKKFMTQKQGQASSDISEAELLIGLMDRRKDWCTIICLIGGGQEINTGEAGLIEWFNALQPRFRHWDVYHSGQLSNKSYNWGEDMELELKSLHAIKNEALHLDVSLRSYRAENISEFVGALIDGQAEQAHMIYPALKNYPLYLTRDINKARDWLKAKARGSERFGLVASSGAVRLKPEGINVTAEIDPVNWFLNDKDDTRSAYYLEDVATELHVQGLELDWAGVCWDADLRIENGSWALYSFKDAKWQNVDYGYRRVYLANAYRVLLTRARQGMVIFLPKGDEKDPTRLPHFYNGTYEFLKQCGIQELP